MLNKNNFLLAVISIIILINPVVQAEGFENPQAFTEYIYNSYSERDFSEVYNNFAAELKRILPENKYTEFQQQNFEKYQLKYTEIKVSAAKEIDFKTIKDKFDYADDFGSYYQLQVSYLLKFKHFGSREEKSEKKVYIRKINDDFQIFWDYKNALNNDEAAEPADKNE
ncbi:hypothetical protein DFR80_10845 [Halanaerobium sp. ST460_2HS_T2]|uniref:DUF3887 domain-containing protein n=1 Tax=Halanaerobium kushneri TaxID=56779 RepID=A0A1N6U528_9FIRM|nr:hypothetical protein DFR80_10845 [Halanaerobium sp. ST460_2HS_T2]SIQ60742.1 hypothetical protein SAMN05421834_10644 [Halanaerobium kushneri]